MSELIDFIVSALAALGDAGCLVSDNAGTQDSLLERALKDFGPSGVREAWKEAATKTGLSYAAPEKSSGNPIIYGKAGGLWILASVEDEGFDRRKKVCTCYKAAFQSPLPFSFSLRKESSLCELANMLAASPGIETGASEFDSAFRVSGDDPEAIRRFLTPERRLVLGDCAKTYPGIMMDERFFIIKSEGVEASELRLRTGMRSLVRCASSLAMET